MYSIAGSRARRAFSFGSALLLSLMLSAAVVAQDDAAGTDAETTEAPATATPASNETSTTVDPSSTQLTLGPWRLVSLPDAPDGAFIRGVASSELGTIALGNREFGSKPKPVVWTSDDGVAFERATIAKDARKGVPSAAAANEDGWVVVGGGSPVRALAWHSPDGRHWKAAAVESAEGHTFDDVAATPVGFVAVGCQAVFHCDVGKAWVSQDGRSWKVLSRLPIQAPGAIDVVGDRIVVAGFSDGWETTNSSAVSATSKNGRNWKLNELAGPLGSGFNSLAVREDAVLAGGYLLGERAPDDSAILASSPDGRAWTPIEPAAFQGWSGSVSATDDLLLMVGTGNFDDFIAPVTYSSADLESWVPGTFTEGLRAEAYHVFDASFTHDGERALMVGAIDYGPAMWTAPVVPVGSPEAEPAPVTPLGPVTPERFAAAITPDGADGAVIHDIISAGPGYIAVGGGGVEGATPEALVWTSADGLEWDVATLAEGAGNGVIEAVSELSDGSYLAVGNDVGAGEALAWHSADGLTWDLVPAHESFAASVFRDVTSTVEGATIVGASAFPDAAAGRVWSSADGLSWGDPGELPLTPLAIGSRGVTLATTGVDDAGRSDGGEGIVAVRGAEGWTASESLGKPASHIVDIATSDDGYVAAGWQQRPGKKVESALFMSPDGLGWQPVTHKRLRGMTATGVGLNDDGVLVVGTKSGEPIAFWTRDLEDFDTIRFPKATELEGLDIAGGTVTADGSKAFAFGSEAGRPAIWHSVIE